MKQILRFFFTNKTRAYLLALLWTALILIACLIPGHEVPHVKVPLIDKYVHFVIFAGFSFLWLCAHKVFKWHYGLLWFVLSIVMGYVVEWLQGSGITQGRSFDWYDVLADAIGGAIGVLLFVVLNQYFYLRKNT